MPQSFSFAIPVSTVKHKWTQHLLLEKIKCHHILFFIHETLDKLDISTSFRGTVTRLWTWIPRSTTRRKLFLFGSKTISATMLKEKRHQSKLWQRNIKTNKQLCIHTYWVEEKGKAEEAWIRTLWEVFFWSNPRSSHLFSPLFRRIGTTESEQQQLTRATRTTRVRSRERKQSLFLVVNSVNPFLLSLLRKQETPLSLKSSWEVVEVAVIDHENAIEFRAYLFTEETEFKKRKMKMGQWEK